jgi:hypothetical protein
MWRLVQADPNVCIALEFRGGKRLLFGPGLPVQQALHPYSAVFGNYLNRPEVRYLSDSIEPGMWPQSQGFGSVVSAS